MESYIQTLGIRAKDASRLCAKLGTEAKNRGLLAVAGELRSQSAYLLEENEKDLKAAKEKGVKQSLIDRLRLTEQRISDMAEGLTQVAALEDPIGEVLSMKNRPNGLRVGKKRVPLGVVGIIYESRPNVTADAFGLCFKTGNAVILRGGSDAIHSNLAVTKVIKGGLEKENLPQDAILLVEDTSRATVGEMMKLHQYIDVLIPRGGAGLIANVVENSTVPVIETGTGNCHIFVDASADIGRAAEIIENAKTQRMGVCNACESLVIHAAAAEEALPLIAERLNAHQVEIRGDERAREILPGIVPATEEDWGTEYLDAVISVKIVDSLEEAIAHINRYNTGHSESILTKDYDNALKFQDEVDAAAVYVNASTRFTDGFEFGFGAEIGISTQKLHARGPMGLEALTSTKYIIFGNGQIRK
ncbi:glutamate-5-semialdehyde dehydrogenase [Schaedlerella arabinosiphila]|uniref:Gamma-glutamyl phosphate reductase n=1 Tax=Schaedlerella arabinosiphila TaxID=2044587 RepID=N2AMD6_9FIRM|nr:glutamate-5-semialdehyde dehydrogenase [Schaedlerella arabinosiphila]MCI9212053.1 glutamate-5-semialdehyde dehydrogenase [Ruminococcus sp.]KAI4444141.1 Gamma-glutamyl phosphate reductase [Schaedlerella arabinosiphila]MDE7066574.1 glutamate-5-semialdehyde dehydrogenase [Schaedlerella arabinosiphila]NDO70484.1 glutamate-5-semialdehyde dehydrogenase [Schaedlerella arabinosiphila]RRK31750.1 glutamate-5-semialdehyde dehydrogenase [Schaedlerella arabinosiphila]